MAVPSELLEELGELEGPLGGMRSAIDQALAASHDPSSRLHVQDGLRLVEEAVAAWLKATERVESRLIGHARERPADLDDVQARIGGLTMLHLAAAADVATLYPLDELSGDDLIFGAQIEGDRASTIQDTAFGEGQIVNAISHQLDEPGEVVGARSDDSDDDEIDEVVAGIVRRGSAASAAVLIGLSGGATKLFATLVPDLTAAVNAAPNEIRKAIVAATRRVIRLVQALVARATKVLAEVLAGYRGAVSSIIGTADPQSVVTESLSSRVLSRIVKADGVRAEAKRLLGAAKNPRPRVRRIRKLIQSHRRWVGPVRVAAKGLPRLWHVPIGPLPTAPIAAVALLGWTLLITGDQLDAPGFPNLWKGVIRRAAGE